MTKSSQSVERKRNPDTLNVKLSKCNLGAVYKEAASRLTLVGGQKIAWVYKHLSQVGQPNNSGQLEAQLLSKGLETIRKLTQAGGLTLLEVFTSEKVDLSGRVTLAHK